MTICLNIAQIKYNTELASNRFKFIYGDAHDFGYLLDPRMFRGNGLPPDDWYQIEDLLHSISEDDKAASMEECKMLLYDQLTQYIIAAHKEKNENSIRFKVLQMNRKIPLQFWQSDGAAWLA